MNRRAFVTILTVPIVGQVLPALRTAACSGPVPPAAIGAPTADFQARIPQLMEVAGVPGIGVSVVHERRVVWQYSYGVTNVKEGRPVLANTLWPAASLGKPVFALAALRLVDEGRLELDRPLKSYLPDHAPDDVRGNRVTARHVLSHSSGLRNWRESTDEPLVPDFEPGSQFQYSGEGYFYLQRVVEHIVGAGFEQFMHERLFAPLGMTSSTYAWRHDTAARLVAGHDRGRAYSIFWEDVAGKLLRYAEQRNRPLAGLTYEDIRAAMPRIAPTARSLPEFLIPNAASSLLTTPADYGAYLMALLSGGPSQVDLKPETRRGMVTSQIRVNSALAWGLGWGIETRAELTAHGSGGNRGAMSNYLWQWGDNGSWKNFVLAHPASRSALVIFTNGSRGLNLARCITRASTGLEHSAFLWL